jgi:hypothetical protein
MTMNLSELISNIHWLPVVVMTVFSFLIGFTWHSTGLFGKTWKAENPQREGKKVNAPLVFGGTAIVHFIALAALSAVVAGQGAVNGLLAGLLISAVWTFTAMAGTYLFASRSLKLLAIDAGMYMVLFMVSGLVLGIW